MACSIACRITSSRATSSSALTEGVTARRGTSASAVDGSLTTSASTSSGSLMLRPGTRASPRADPYRFEMDQAAPSECRPPVKTWPHLVLRHLGGHMAVETNPAPRCVVQDADQDVRDLLGLVL